jgi:L-methionine (R)-S-oxide reductase
MTEYPELDRNQSETEIYKSLYPIVDNILSSGDPVISALANITALLKESLTKVSWVGFYILKGSTLYLAPFQGKLACTQIAYGKGVCGASVARKETIIVSDVTKFDGHIACDSDSRSEIVVPLIKNGVVFGVIDLDSTSFNAFNDDDKHHIEQISSLISSKIDLEILKNIII